MKIIRIIKSIYKVFSIKEDEAIYACLKKDIPLTDENILHMIEIIKQDKERKKLKILKRVGSLNFIF